MLFDAGSSRRLKTRENMILKLNRIVLDFKQIWSVLNPTTGNIADQPIMKVFKSK